MTAIHFIFILFCSLMSHSETNSFRFHSSLEPATVDPAALTEPTGGFIFFNLFRSLYSLDENLKPKPLLAESCSEVRPLIWKCLLKTNARFSDGSAIHASHYVQAWRRLFRKERLSRHVDLLQGVLNADKILRGDAPIESLGVRALSEWELEIQLTKSDGEFLFKLSSPILTALKTEPPHRPSDFSKLVSTGPYQIRDWAKGTRIILGNNQHYIDPTPRPPVEVLLVEEDTTALQMYDLNKIDFLRRLNIKEIPKRKTSAEFIFQPMLRFDYIGFGPSLRDLPELRKALALSLNYPELSKAYMTPSQIGCPSIPKSWANPWPCVSFQLKEAKAAFKKIPKEKLPPKLVFKFSKGGGEDILRGMEWMQAQWKKNLGLNVELSIQEPQSFLAQIKLNPGDLFRKGFNLDRPTCLSAIENFTTGAPENFQRLSLSPLDALVGEVQAGSQTASQKQCGEMLKILIQDYWLIPLGELYFAMLAKKNFVGWRLTPLNQLDLTQLKPAN